MTTALTTTPATTTLLAQQRQPGAKANDKPLAQVEGLKQQALHPING